MPRTTLNECDRVAGYLFSQMCSNSAAGHMMPDLERWYEDGLDFYNSIIEEQTS